jgi:hypothetical protein
MFKLFSLWPRAERWLVIAALIALPPVAVYVLGWAATIGSISNNTFTPNRDSAIFWTAISGVLVVAWWAIKKRTNWLAAPSTVVPSDKHARPTPTPTASTEAEVREPAQRKTAAQPSAPSPPAGPERARAIPQAAETPTRAATDSIFISYRRQDSADVTGRIYDRLIQRFDRKQVFKDVDSIPLGVDFRAHLGDVVGRCSIVLAVIGPQWLSAAGPTGRRLDDIGDFVRIEIEAALARNISVIPVLVGGVELPAEMDLPASLAALTYRNGIAVRPDPDFHRDMDRLIAGLELHKGH